VLNWGVRSPFGYSLSGFCHLKTFRNWKFKE